MSNSKKMWSVCGVIACILCLWMQINQEMRILPRKDDNHANLISNKTFARLLISRHFIWLVIERKIRYSVDV